jgi:hypothetical protein
VRRLIVIAAVLTLTLFSGAFGSTAKANTVVVDNNGDQQNAFCFFDAPCQCPSGSCTLRSAIWLANNSTAYGQAVVDRIEFSADFDSPQTITLGSTLSIEAATATLTIFGRSGVNIVAVASDAFGVDKRTTTLQNLKISSTPFSAVSVSNNQTRTLSLQNVTLTGTLHGLLLNAGSVVNVSGSTISGSGGSSVNGGGIFVTQATLNINSTTISNNTGLNGGGIYAEQGSVLTVFSCTISNNSAADGGGLHIRNSQIFLNDNVILSNTATLGGGFFGHLISSASTILGNSIRSNAATNGGGLYFESGGTQTIQNSDISSNSARYGGGLYLDQSTNAKLISSTMFANIASNGAGAYAGAGAFLTLSSSTVANNQSNNSQGDARIGGGIYTQSLLNLINSTVSGNSAAGINGGMSAGGIFIDELVPNGKIVNSTITNNSATGSNAVGGLGLRGNNISMPVYNTILAANQTLPDVSPGMLVNQSNNFINGNPGLLPLANYGGPTSTHAFPCSSNSPAINAGNNSLALDENGQPLTLDQRGDGFPRIFGGTVDIGAVESSSTAVTNNSDDVNTVGSLRWAINTAPGGAICFDPVYFSVSRTISMTAGEILINKSLQINGPGSNLLTLDANNLSRHIFVSTATVSLSGMTLIHGHTNANDPQQGSGGSIYVNPGVTFSASNLSITGGIGETFGACIFSNNATSSLTDSTVANCLAAGGTGGGLFNQTGAMTLTRVTVSGSTAIQGGGIFNSGQLNIDSSTITGNTATRPAGQGSAPLGGGISNAGNLSFANSTLSNNSAQFGGGIYNVPNTGTNGYVDIHNSTVSGNTAVNTGNGATADGGGIYADGNYVGGLTATIDVHSITMSGNTAVNSGGGLFMHQVSGSFAVSNLHNSIIAGNSAGAGPDISGQVIGYGYDLIGNTSGSSFAGNSPSLTGNILNPAGGARLAPIDNYGGPTKTFALSPNSPAIDAGDPSFFYNPDQRGSLRPVGANPDIGSFERNIILANPPDGRSGIPYSQALTGTRLPGPSPLVTFSIFPVAGQGLPPGLSLAGNGTLSGTPTTLGSYTFTVKAATADGLADIAQVTMNILPAWPTIQKSFDAATIPLFGATVLTFTISNPNLATDLTGVAFTDLLPSATGKLVINNNPNVNSNCGGTVTAPPSGSSITLSSGTVTHNSTCTISVLLTGTAAGDANNTTSAITSNESGTGATSNTALVKIVNPPTIQKAFGASTIPLNGTTTLTFTLTNPSVNTTKADGISFSDSLQHGLKVAATPGVTSSCGGTVTANAGAGSISFSGGSIATGSQCTITVNVTGTQLGDAPNQAGPIISDNGGPGSSSNSVTLKVLTPPTIQKTFGATNIPLNGTTTLTFTISNPATNTASVDGIAFSDTLQNGLVVGTPNGLSNSCGGTATAVAGSTSISLSGGSVATPGNTCTIAVNVNGTQSGDVTNTTGAVSSTNAGTGQTSNTATLKVLTPPTIQKVFGATSIPLNGTTALTFTITNPAANNMSASGIAFSDTLQNGLKVATLNGVSNTCGGSVTAVAGSTSISLSGGSIANSGDTCTLAVNVNGTQTGNVSNTTGAVSSTNAGTGAASNTATMNVVGAPTIQKAFGAATIPLNGTTTLSFTITNPAANPTSADGIAFSDTLQSGLQVASPNGLSNTCGGSVTATAGLSSISLLGGSIATPGATCTVTVSVTGTQSGNVPNTTSAVSSTNGGTGAVSNTANLIVVSPPTIQKAFSASTIPLNGTTTLTFTITNPNSATDFTGVAFSDMLPTTPGTIVVGSTPNVNNGCGGTVTATAGAGSISLANGNVTHNGQCTLKVDVKGTVAGNVSNITGAVSSTEGGTGTASNIATLTVEAAVPPTIQKAFSASTIPLNGTTTLTFTISNSNTATDLSGVAFSDTLPSTVGTIVVAPTPNVINGCGGTVTANAGAGSISLANGNVTHNGQCTLKVDVKGTVTGDLSNITGAVSSTEGGTGTTSNTATLKVVAPPTIQKAFSDASIALNATTTVSFTITNPAVNTTALNGIAFSDSLQQNGLKVAASPGVTNNCNGSVTATPGSTSISLSGGSISTPGKQCTITVKVTPTQSGNITNTTGAVSSTNGGTGVASNTASLTVIAPPTIEKAFGASSIAFNGTASLTFTIQNSNAISLTGVSFTDTFPAGLQVAAPPNVSNGCGGTFSPSPGDVSLTFSGGTVPPGSFCTVSVDVKGTTTGTKNNTTAAISSTEGGTGTTSNTAQLSVGCLSSTVVTNNNDSGAGSLRDALANIGVSICVGGTITFDPALSGQTINLTSDQLIINQSVTITGPGSNLLTIRRGNAAPDFRIMKIASGVVNISGLTISNGSESNGEGGGGIRNDGTLTLTDCAISANVSKVIDDGFGDLSPGIGGGIRNNGSLTITNSIISGNTAASAPDTGTGGANGLGGGIYNVSPNTVTIQDSTVSGNTATLGGGFMDDFGTMNITRCAIVSNSADVGGGIYTGGTMTVKDTTISGNTIGPGFSGLSSASGVFNAGGHATFVNVTVTANGPNGGIENRGDFKILNTIVAGNIGGDATSVITSFGGPFTSLGHNLIGDGTGSIGFNPVSDQVGTSGAPIDPRLAPLGNYGGPTKTHALLFNSPAIDAANDCVFINLCSGVNLGSPMTTDQRGFSRKVDDNMVPGNHVDIGAVEREEPEVRSTFTGSNVNNYFADLTITFPAVTVAGSTSVTDITQGTLPNGYSSCSGCPSFDISTTATFTGPVNLCFYLPTVSAGDFPSLRVLHDTGSGLVDNGTSQVFPASHLICATTNSFSPFTIGKGSSPTAANGSISGKITETSGAPIAGVTINLGGSQSSETISDANGNYSFEAVETNGFYTVTPARANYTFSPASRSFSLLGDHTEASFIASPNGDHTNAIDTTEFFVRQQYLDFLGREPDSPGFNGWVGTLRNCAPNDASCDRIHVSESFFRSAEFQERGYFVYRFYSAAFGRKPDYAEFTPDLARVSGFLTNDQLEAAKTTFANDFIARPQFAAQYGSLSNSAYVDALINTAQVSLTNRQALIDGLNAGTLMRGAVLRQIAESAEVYRKYYNQAFVVMEYFGYLRRDPDALYLNWIQVLDANPADSRHMVEGFVSSTEYRNRFVQ